MLFSSFTFFYEFLPVTFAAYFLASYYKPALAIPVLVLASIFFYSYWDVRFLPLLIFSILMNYYLGRVLLDLSPVNRPRARLILAAGLVLNLALLMYFKYMNWFLESANHILGLKIVTLDIVLPLGISFFTFTQIAYLVDIFSNKVTERNISNFFLFVSYFPHLIAGPILHHSEMMPQFSSKLNKRISLPNVTFGLLLFFIGVIKKIGFADTVAPFADRIFNAEGPFSASEAWSGALAYSAQIYFDFSGYTDMALGLSRMFNIFLPINFDSPYKATSIVEFWRRWHMTLSRFLRDYLYIPLGGNRRGVLRRYLNLFATMVLGGVWHGAGWTFLIWGALHGVYLIVSHALSNLRERWNIRWSWWMDYFAQLATFLAVVVAWVFFRATGLESALRILQAMIDLNASSANRVIPEYPDGLLGWIGDATWFWIVTLLLLSFFAPNSLQITSWAETSLGKGLKKNQSYLLISLAGFLITGIGFVISVTGMRHGASPFIYFNF
jgi:alginate O-acetyltransferase complex protein AlgI